MDREVFLLKREEIQKRMQVKRASLEVAGSPDSSSRTQKIMSFIKTAIKLFVFRNRPSFVNAILVSLGLQFLDVVLPSRFKDFFSVIYKKFGT